MLARVPLGENLPVVGEYLTPLMNWIMDVPNIAARRAIFIGAALGAVLYQKMKAKEQVTLEMTAGQA